MAARAGASRGAAQYHFPTRGDLVTAAIRHMTRIRLGELHTTIEPRPTIQPDPLEQQARRQAGFVLVAVDHERRSQRSQMLRDAGQRKQASSPASWRFTGQ